MRQGEETVASARVRKLSRDLHRKRVHDRVRTKVSGTTERPRLCVYRSLDHIYAQVIDDHTGKTLVSASSVDGETKKNLKTGGNVAAAKVIGKAVAERAKAVGVQKVVFDRGGYKYHGRVKALADAAREAGLQF
jgi:large subunit ribosomal protein L18